MLQACNWMAALYTYKRSPDMRINMLMLATVTPCHTCATSQLVGKAQQAYAALGVDEASDYEQLKQAVLRRYDINEESHRRRFRTASKKDGETNRELVTRPV